MHFEVLSTKYVTFLLHFSVRITFLKMQGVLQGPPPLQWIAVDLLWYKGPPLTSHLPPNLEESFFCFSNFSTLSKSRVWWWACERGGCELLLCPLSRWSFASIVTLLKTLLFTSLTPLYLSPSPEAPIACTHVLPRFAEKKTQLLRKKKESSLKITVSIYYLFCFKSKMALIFPPTSGKRSY